MATGSLHSVSMTTDHPSGATRWEMWRRRLVTIPGYLLLTAAAIAMLPLLLGVAAIADLLRGGPWPIVRAVAFAAFYLCCESIGIVASGVLWLRHCLSGRADSQAYLRRNFVLQCWWARTLFRGVQRIFGVRVHVDEVGDVGRGPVIVFSRHASVGDTLLPAVFLADRYGLRLRYVMKRELLWDACLDIVGNRLPNYFVRRGSGDSEREIAAVQQLMDGLGAHDGVLIYPEGTRFTPAKRARILARLESSADADLVEAARSLRHVLPPRLGGPLALLAANTAAAAVFCAHVGFEGTATVRDLLSGSLVRRTIRVCFWRVPYDEIPRDRAAHAAWLYGQWRRIDAWIADHRPVGAAEVAHD